MTEKRYTKDHEWIEHKEGDIYRIGITDHAQAQLGDVVLVELPEVGKTFKDKDTLAVIDSVKAASDIYSPISGEIVRVNTDLEENPGLINESAESEAWLVELKSPDAHDKIDLLMDSDSYQEFTNAD